MKIRVFVQQKPQLSSKVCISGKCYFELVSVKAVFLVTSYFENMHTQRCKVNI